MKQLSILALLLVLGSCCKNDCDNAPSFDKCSETYQTSGNVCDAYWESWFWDQSTGQCEKMGYSGCEPAGFDTKSECEKCDCHRLEGAK